MPSITVSDADARMIAECRTALEVKDLAGHVIGHVVAAFTPMDVQIAKARLIGDGTRSPTAEVLTRLKEAKAQ